MSGLFGAGKTNAPVAAAGLQINTSAYGLPITIIYGQCRSAINVAWYGAFTAVKNSSGKDGKGGSQGYTYTASFVLALCEGPVAGVPTCWITQSQFAIGDVPGATVFDGTYPQTPWGYLTTNFPNDAIPFSGICYVAMANHNLGNSATLPNFNFEVQGILIGSAANHIDADPAQVVTDLLTNVKYGAGFPVNRVGAMVTVVEADTVPGTPYQIAVADSAEFQYNCTVTYAGGANLKCVAASPGPGQYTVTVGGTYTFNSADAGASITITYAALFPYIFDPTPNSYWNWAEASGLWISPVYATATQTSSLLDDIATHTISEFVWASGALNIIPRGAVDVTGNGFTYTAPSAVLFNLTDDDFMANQYGSGASASDDPVLLSRKRKSDQINVVKLEFLNRGNAYATEVVEVTNQALVDVYQRRSISRQAHLFCDPSAASTSAQLQLQQEAILNAYSIQLDQRYAVLDPMDLVNLADSYLFPDLAGNLQDARITEITENDDGTLTVLLEEYPVGLGTGALYSLNQGTGYIPKYNNDPGNVNTPFIFQPPLSLTGNVPEIWLGASGANPLWGGCDVYVSLDNTTYELVGHISHAATQGVSTATFASGSDPDTTHTLSVNLAESFGSLTSVATALADKYVTVSAVADDGIGTNLEIIAYSTATLTGGNAYSITSYTRRGGYGTAIASHASGSQFCVLDGSILPFTLPITPVSYIGQTLYFKFCSVNIYGQGLQSLASVSPYVFTPNASAPHAPGIPTGLTATPGTGQVALTWNANPSTDNVTAYAVYRAPGLGASFGSASRIALTLSLGYLDTSVTPASAYTYFLLAGNLIGQGTQTAGVNATVPGSPANALRWYYSNPGSNFGSSQVIIDIPMVGGEILPVGLAGSVIECEGAPTANWTVTWAKNGTPFATGTILAGATTGTYTSAAGMPTSSAGDRVTCTAPATDATFRGFQTVVVGTR